MAKQDRFEHIEEKYEGIKELINLGKKQVSTKKTVKKKAAAVTKRKSTTSKKTTSKKKTTKEVIKSAKDKDNGT